MSMKTTQEQKKKKLIAERCYKCLFLRLGIAWLDGWNRYCNMQWKNISNKFRDVTELFPSEGSVMFIFSFHQVNEKLWFSSWATPCGRNWNNSAHVYNVQSLKSTKVFIKIWPLLSNNYIEIKKIVEKSCRVSLYDTEAAMSAALYQWFTGMKKVISAFLITYIRVIIITILKKQRIYRLSESITHFKRCGRVRTSSSSHHIQTLQVYVLF